MKRLKLREGIDFNILKSFGFVECDNDYYTLQFEHDGHYFSYWINKKTRLIELEITTDIFTIPSALYKLIQLDFIEEVE